MTESVVIALAGGAIGTVLARWGVKLIALSFPNEVPFYIRLALDPVAISFATVVSLVAALVFGLVPALRATEVDLNTSLREGGRGEIGGGRSARLRGSLVVAEVALAVVLVVGATLLVRSYRALTSTHLGFDTKGILAARVSLPDERYRSREERAVFWGQLLERVRALPGVEAVGSASGIPFSGWNVQASFSVEGRPAPAQGQELVAHYQNVSPDYFKAIGVPLLQGRMLTPADRDTSVHIGVINEVLARREFPNESPIGKRIRFGGEDSRDPWVTIVGVVGEFRHYRLPQPMGPAMYFPLFAWPSSTQTLAIRTTLADPLALESSVRRVLRELDPNVPAYQVRTFEQSASRSLWQQRLQGQVLGTFAMLALALAVVGIYGVISYAVAQRTREFGVRMALGATKAQVMALVVRQGVRLTALGVVLGVAGALALTRVVATLLYGVTATDRATFVGVPLGLAAVAILASCLPAMRATRVDPAVAIRE
jgi:predicted permease